VLGALQRSDPSACPVAGVCGIGQLVFPRRSEFSRVKILIRQFKPVAFSLDSDSRYRSIAALKLAMNIFSVSGVSLLNPSL